MPIFPPIRPENIDTSGNEILAQMETQYSEGITYNQSYWLQADIDNRYYAGQQDYATNIYNYNTFNGTNRRQFYFNRINPIVNMISGYQRETRKSTAAVPRHNGNQETADQYTKVLFWNNQKEGILETISEAFHGALISGMNLLHVYMDYSNDAVSGDIKVDNCSYNGFMVDPFFRKADLSDCNWIWKRSYVTKNEAVALLPHRADEIIGLNGNASNLGPDAKFAYMPEVYNFGMRNLLTYDEYYYRAFRKQINLIDSRTGEQWEWPNQDIKKLKKFLKKEPKLEVIEATIPTVKLAIVIQGKVFYNERNVSGSDLYPFVPVFAYYNPQMPYYDLRIISVVRSLRDPQYLYNKFLINMADILDSQVNSGFIYKEDALVDPEDVYLQGNGKGIALKSGAAMSDIQKIQPGEASSSMFKLAEIFGDELFKSSGANEATMGSAVDDKVGILEMLKQGAGLRILRILFDQLDRAQKLVGKLQMDYIQKNFTPGKIQQIVGENPAPQFYSQEFGEYDVAIEEGYNTTTQKQLQFAQAVKLREAGVPITDQDLLEMSTMQNKNKLIENMMAQQQQKQQMEQQQAQMQMEQLKSQINLSNARAKADEGLGIERHSRVAENQSLAVERLAKAASDEEAALLNKIKVLKELEGIDIQHLRELLAMANVVEKNIAKPVGNEVPQFNSGVPVQ